MSSIKDRLDHMMQEVRRTGRVPNPAFLRPAREGEGVNPAYMATEMSITRDIYQLDGDYSRKFKLMYWAYQVRYSEDMDHVAKSLISGIFDIFAGVENLLDGFRLVKVKLTSQVQSGSSSTPPPPPTVIVASGTEVPQDVFVAISEAGLKRIAGIVEVNEIGFLFGIWTVCIQKNVDEANHSAYNSRRQNAVTAFLLAEPQLFTLHSEFLSLQVLKKIKRSFQFATAYRCAAFTPIVRLTEYGFEGAALCFMTFFKFNCTAGLRTLAMITETVEAFPEVLGRFFDLDAEWVAYFDSCSDFPNVDEVLRPYYKFLHGHNFVVIPQRSVKNIIPICRDIIGVVKPTYNRFAPKLYVAPRYRDRVNELKARAAQ